MTSYTMRGRRTGPLVLATILGFMIWWPLGVAALAVLLWGDRLDPARLEARVRHGYGRLRRGLMGQGFMGQGFERGWGPSARDTRWQATGWSNTGNAAFDAYKAETLSRLEEERRRLDEESRAFSEFVADLRRARDKEEFDRFMAARRGPAA